MSLKARLFIMFALVVLPFVGSAAYFHYTHYSSSKGAAITEQRALADLLARSVEAFIQRSVSLQRSAGEALVVAHWPEKGAPHRYLVMVLESTRALENIAFAAPSGVITEAAPQKYVGRSVAGTPHFARILSGAQWTVSTSTRENLPGEGGVVLATAIRDSSGRLQGVVLSGISESRFGSIIEPVAGSEARLFVADNMGQAVYMSGSLKASATGRDFSRFSLVRKALAGQPASSSEFILPDGMVTVGAVAPIKSIHWAAGAFVPESQVLGAAIAGVIRDILITIGIIMLAIVLGSLLSRRLTKQVSDLAGTAEKLGQGNLHVRAAIPNIAEMASLATTINTMADSIQERDTKIRMALTRERKSAREASALYNITGSLIGSLLLSDRLQALADGMATLAGTATCVFYVNEDDQLVVGAVSGMTGSYEEKKIKYQELKGPVGAALRSGSPAVVQAPDAGLNEVTIGDTQSALVLPVMSDMILLGAAVLYTVGANVQFSADIIVTETALAKLACRAISEARSFEREQRIARVLQHTILGRVPHGVGPVEIGTGYFPVREEAEIGGDLYDVTVLPDGLMGILVADVVGKGLRAATNTAMIKYLIEGFAYHDKDPSTVLAKVNDIATYSTEEWAFTTAFFGLLNVETGELVWANAGHPAPLVKDSKGETRWLETPPGPPLGVAENQKYPSTRVILNPGDMMVLYTDGVIEARRNGQLFDSEGLEKLAPSFSASPDEVVDLIYQAARDFAGGRLQDDIALVVLKMGENA